MGHMHRDSKNRRKGIEHGECHTKCDDVQALASCSLACRIGVSSEEVHLGCRCVRRAQQPVRKAGKKYHGFATMHASGCDKNANPSKITFYQRLQSID